MRDRKENDMSCVLYHERREKQDHYVEVQVRLWTCGAMTPDVVIESRAMVDGDLTVDMREVYPHDETNAHFIRMGMERFDKLVDSHPFLN